MNTHEAETLARELMLKHGLIGWRFCWLDSLSLCGQCRHDSKQILLSVKYVMHNPVELVRDTILHEIAHAICGYLHGHDEVWKAKALEIGCNGQRITPGKLIPKRYKAVCNTCGNASYRERMNRNMGKSACGYCCKGKYNPQFVLTWVDTKLIPQEVSNVQA